MNDNKLLKILFEKGEYRKINSNFITEGTEALQYVSAIQDKYEKHDTDTFINELRDFIVGQYLGFDLINTRKHGFDCKREKDEIYLEAKDASLSSTSWQATFNDTTYEKSEAFKTSKLYLALSVWHNASDLLFIAFGQNSKISEFLNEKIDSFKKSNTVRSTQSITLLNLVNNYNFHILCVNKTIEGVCQLLRIKYRNILIDKTRIHDLTTFTDIVDYK
jgi:hypothetical protein